MEILNKEKVLDRLMEAAARSPITIDNAVGQIHVKYELTRSGVKIRGIGPKDTYYNLIVSWFELDSAVVDPLTYNLNQVIRGLIHAGS